MRYRCPSCKTVNMLDIKDQGTQIQCGRCDNALTVPSDYMTPGIVFGDFALLENVISRSHETDFRAEQISLQREVILKVIKPSLCQNSEFVKSFLEAGRCASQLSHPYLCQIIGVGKENDIYFLAREIGGSQSLRDHLVEKGVLHWKGALKLTSEIAEALDFSWKIGQVRHLNLKPDYVVVDIHNHARIADVGMAGLNPDPGSDRIIGTPQYIAPERIVGLDGDNRSDLYSLGVTLFFMLTGQFPFKANNTSEYIDKHLNEAPRKANSVIDDVPDVVCDVVNMLLEKNPNTRYQSGELLIQDIKAILRGQQPTYVYSPETQPVQPVKAAIPVDENPPTLTVKLEDEPSADAPAPPVPVAQAMPVAQAVPVAEATPVAEPVTTPEPPPAPAAPEIKLVTKTTEHQTETAIKDIPLADPAPAIPAPVVAQAVSVEAKSTDDQAEVETEESAESSVQAALDDLDSVFTDFSLDEPGDEPDDEPSDPAPKSEAKDIATTFDTHIDVDDVFSDLDNIFDDLDAELELDSAAPASTTEPVVTEDPIQSEEFNQIVAELQDDKVKTPLPVMPDEVPVRGLGENDETPVPLVPREPPSEFPKVVPAVQGDDTSNRIAMAQPVDSDMSFIPAPEEPEVPEVIQLQPEQPIMQGIPLAHAAPEVDPVADEVDALFDEDLPPAMPVQDEAPTSFPAIGQEQASAPAPGKPPGSQGLRKKKKLKTRSKSKFNIRRK